MTTPPATINADLLTWYRPRRRAYPWRTDPPDPYRVLVSEVMLQQTQASRVVPAFGSFIARFPRVEALAKAPRSEVIREWGTLGYNRRAVALSEAARAIVRDHHGRVPSEPERLRQLPGVGTYTVSAVASIAFGAAVPALDTNVRRVVARVRLGAEPHELKPADVADAARDWMDGANPADWNQAVMDLGREICRPAPRCDACPLARHCRFRADGRRATRPPRRRGRFEGSSRQLRGAIVRALRARPTTIRSLVSTTARTVPDVRAAVAALIREGIAEETKTGRIRLSR